jgi:hypothetical protein
VGRPPGVNGSSASRLVSGRWRRSDQQRVEGQALVLLDARGAGPPSQVSHLTRDPTIGFPLAPVGRRQVPVSHHTSSSHGSPPPSSSHPTTYFPTRSHACPTYECSSRNPRCHVAPPDADLPLASVQAQPLLASISG